MDLLTLISIGISVISVVFGAASVFYSRQQVKQSKEEVKLARQQLEHAKEQVRLAQLPKPSAPEYGLTIDTHIDPSIFGRYEGKSQNNKWTRSGLVAVEQDRYAEHHIEQFTIAQVYGKITIEGKSFLLSNGVAVSRWYGTVWQIAQDGTLYFGVELFYRGVQEFGNLIVTCRNNEAEGFFHSGQLNAKYVYSFKAKKVLTFSTPMQLSDQVVSAPRS